jgi:REP element-mobilizing transposase RayT
MPDTFTHLRYHLIFGTKNRSPLITLDVREDLYGYFAGVVSRFGGTLVAVGGMPDHVHLLVGLGPTHLISDLMHQLKGASSRWMNERGAEPFAWQNGYGAFSVSGSNVSKVANYIHRQEEHHGRFTFQDEVAELLKRHGREADSPR